MELTAGSLLRRLFRFPGERFSALDPCARGAGLADLVRGTGADTWAVVEREEDLGRFARRFSRVVLGPWHLCQAPEGAFSLLFLDPGRMARTWLRATWRCLAPGGVLLWVCPPEELDAGTARFLCDRFSDAAAWAVPGGVAVTGVRRPRLRGDVRAERALLGVAAAPPDPAGGPEAAYPVPPSEPARIVPALPDEAEARALVESSPLWRLFRRDTRRGLGRPPVPLHAGHVALLLAAGHLDGVVGE
ncbi:MAG: hypothetical protein AB1609_18725, partial [Bacillota bacterium]